MSAASLPLKRVLIGDQDSAGLNETQRGDHPFRTVEGPQGDPLAGFDAGCHERSAEHAGSGEELGEGESGGAVLDGGSIAEFFGGTGRDRRKGQIPTPDAVAHRERVSATFINLARLPPMILCTASSSRPSSSST